MADKNNQQQEEEKKDPSTSSEPTAPEKEAEVKDVTTEKEEGEVMQEETTLTEEKKVDKPKKTEKPKKGKKAVKLVSHGRAYIKATYNNTVITFTDLNGNTIAWSSAGVCGFKGPKKATPYAAGVIVRDAANKVQDYGLKEVSVFVRGVGSGREAAVRALNANGIQVLTIKDVTPIPHGGVRVPRPRRV